MSFEEVMQVIRNLAKSQGFYGRLLEEIQGFDKEQLFAFKNIVAFENFQDDLDLVMFLEG